MTIPQYREFRPWRIWRLDHLNELHVSPKSSYRVDATLVLKQNKFENVEILLWYKPPEPRKKKKLLLYMKYWSWLSNSLIGILKNGGVYTNKSPGFHPLPYTNRAGFCPLLTWSFPSNHRIQSDSNTFWFNWGVFLEPFGAQNGRSRYTSTYTFTVNVHASSGYPLHTVYSLSPGRKAHMPTSWHIHQVAGLRNIPKTWSALCPLAAPSRKNHGKMGPKKKRGKENLEPTYQAIRVPIRMRDLPCLKPETTHNSNEHRPRPQNEGLIFQPSMFRDYVSFGGGYILFGHQKFASHPIAWHGVCEVDSFGWIIPTQRAREEEVGVKPASETWWS